MKSFTLPTIRRTGLAALGLFIVPAVAFAQVTDIFSLLALFDNILNALVPVIVGLALVVFLYGLIQYVTAGDSDREGAINYMTWGIIALFVIISVWGLVGILSGTFQLGNPTPQLPQVP